MAPYLCEGDCIVVQQPTRPIRIGDIVVVWKGEYLMAHRCINQRGNCVITKGDNYYLRDPPVQHDQVVGIATRVIKRSSFSYSLQYRAFNLAAVAYAWIEYFLITYGLRIDHKTTIGNRIKAGLQPLYVIIFVLYECYASLSYLPRRFTWKCT